MSFGFWIFDFGWRLNFVGRRTNRPGAQSKIQNPKSKISCSSGETHAYA